MIQIRNVPDALNRRLKARAAPEGEPLPGYRLGPIREPAERPAALPLQATVGRGHPTLARGETGREVREAGNPAGHRPSAPAPLA